MQESEFDVSDERVCVLSSYLTTAASAVIGFSTDFQPKFRRTEFRTRRFFISSRVEHTQYSFGAEQRAAPKL